MAKKKLTEFKLGCNCGAMAPVFDIGEKGYMAQCTGCGSTTLFRSPAILERLRDGNTACLHHAPVVPCKTGFTSWCRICRVRTFYYEKPATPEVDASLQTSPMC